MSVKVTTSCVNWSQAPTVLHSPQTLAFSISPPLKRIDRTTLFGSQSSGLYRSRSCEFPISGVQTLRRACSASFDSANDVEFFFSKLRNSDEESEAMDDYGTKLSRNESHNVNIEGGSKFSGTSSSVSKTESIEGDRVKMEPENYTDYVKTEVYYHALLADDPGNALILTNFAQFLYTVGHEYERAEEYFRRAIASFSMDGEVQSKYGRFLWKVKRDLWGAEECFLSALSEDPTNSYHAANYAHFLWGSGGDDTCFPLTTSPT